MPGQSSLRLSVLSGVSTVSRWLCRSSGLRIDVQQPGDDLALGGVLLQERHRRRRDRAVIVGVDLAQRDPGAVVLLDQLHGARGVIHRDRVASAR